MSDCERFWTPFFVEVWENLVRNNPDKNELSIAGKKCTVIDIVNGQCSCPNGSWNPFHFYYCVQKLSLQFSIFCVHNFCYRKTVEQKKDQLVFFPLCFNTWPVNLQTKLLKEKNSDWTRWASCDLVFLLCFAERTHRRRSGNIRQTRHGKCLLQLPWQHDPIKMSTTMSNWDVLGSSPGVGLWSARKGTVLHGRVRLSWRNGFEFDPRRRNVCPIRGLSMSSFCTSVLEKSDHTARLQHVVRDRCFDWKRN